MRPRRHLAASWFAAAACAATLTPASAASPAPSSAGPPPSAAVSSLLGPGYCPDGARRDAASATVRALAVDAAGTVFFDTGPAAAGSVARVAADGGVSLLTTGIASGRPAPSPGAAPGLVPSPGRLAADGSGGVLIAAGARVVDLDAANALTTVAGDPAAIGDGDGGGSSGDGGAAGSARFARAAALATDSSGNIFIADVSGGSSPRAVIRFINRSGHTVTFYGGTPNAVAVDPGRIATIAGSAAPSSGAEPGATASAAGTAYLPGPAPAMAVAGARLYLAIPAPDSGRARVLAVDLGGDPITAQGVALAPGQIAAVAGTGSGTTEADSFPVSTVTGLAATADGRLFLAEETRHRVLQADPAGHLTVVAGRPGGRPSDAGFDGDGGPASGTRLARPFDVKLGGDRLYITDQDNGEVRAVDPDGIIRAVRGGGVAVRWACSAARSGELFGSPAAPTGVVVTAAGVVYVALPPLNRVQRLDLAGVATTVAGGGAHDPGCRQDPSCRGFSGDGGPAADARLDRPTALALGPAGELYILDVGNARVRVVNLADRTLRIDGVSVDPGDIATVAGNGVAGSAGDRGAALRANILGAPGYARRAESISSQIGDPRFYALGSLAVGQSGDLFIAGGSEHRVRRVDARGVITSVTAVADHASGACCADPVAVAADSAGHLYIADRGTDDAGVLHPRVWVMNRTGRAATALGVAIPAGATLPVAGNGAFGSDGDGGPALQASLAVGIALAASRQGALFITEAGVSTAGGVRLSDVRSVDASGTIATVVGGDAVAFNGDGLPAALTDLDLPSGAATDRCGNLLIADTGNDRVRRALLSGPCAPIGEAVLPETGLPAALLPAVLGLGAAAVATTAVLLRSRVRRRPAPVRPEPPATPRR